MLHLIAFAFGIVVFVALIGVCVGYALGYKDAKTNS